MTQILMDDDCIQIKTIQETIDLLKVVNSTFVTTQIINQFGDMGSAINQWLSDAQYIIHHYASSLDSSIRSDLIQLVPTNSTLELNYEAINKLLIPEANHQIKMTNEFACLQILHSKVIIWAKEFQELGRSNKFNERFNELIQNSATDSEVVIVEGEPQLEDLIERFERLENARLPVPTDLLGEVQQQLRILKWDRRESQLRSASQVTMNKIIALANDGMHPDIVMAFPDRAREMIEQRHKCEEWLQLLANTADTSDLSSVRDLVAKGALLQFSNLQDFRDLKKHHELLEEIQRSWNAFLKGELALSDLKLLIQMKERIKDESRSEHLAILELLNNTKTAAQKFKSACQKVKLIPNTE